MNHLHGSPSPPDKDQAPQPAKGGPTRSRPCHASGLCPGPLLGDPHLPWRPASTPTAKGGLPRLLWPHCLWTSLLPPYCHQDRTKIHKVPHPLPPASTPASASQFVFLYSSCILAHCISSSSKAPPVSRPLHRRFSLPVVPFCSLPTMPLGLSCRPG